MWSPRNGLHPATPVSDDRECGNNKKESDRIERRKWVGRIVKEVECKEMECGLFGPPLTSVGGLGKVGSWNMWPKVPKSLQSDEPCPAVSCDMIHKIFCLAAIMDTVGDFANVILAPKHIKKMSCCVDLGMLCTLRFSRMYVGSCGTLIPVTFHRRWRNLFQ